MGSVSNVSSGLAYLTQAGGVLSNLPAAVSASDLKSASPQDIVSLSVAAIQAQQASSLFGVPQANQSAIGLPLASNATTETNVLPGVSAADLSNATSQEHAAINDQALQLQQVQTLFDPTLRATTNFSLDA